MINVRVRTIGAICRSLGVRELDVILDAGLTAESLLQHLTERYGDVLAPWVAGGTGHVRTEGIRILVNGRDLFVLSDMNTVLMDGDVVSLIPVVAGGV